MIQNRLCNNSSAVKRTECLCKTVARFFHKQTLFRIGSYIIIYSVLIVLAFVFLYPYIYMVLTSVKQPKDLYDVTIHWIPRHATLDNYRQAWTVLNYPLHFLNSTIIAVGATIGHVLSAAVVGYGFARFSFKGKNLLFTLAIVTLIVPPQTIIIPLYQGYYDLNWLDLPLPLIIPAFFGNGLKGALFIFLFRQIFQGLPNDLENAAKLDGCGVFRAFGKIAFPLAGPAVLVTVILSLVWHWNDFFEPQVYLVTQERFTLPMLLPGLWNLYNSTMGNAVEAMNTTIPMACSCLVLLPMLITYTFLQRRFMKGIERSGLVG